jgi:hypothetical protein
MSKQRRASSEPISIWHALRIREKKLALAHIAVCRQTIRAAAERAAARQGR